MDHAVLTTLTQHYYLSDQLQYIIDVYAGQPDHISYEAESSRRYKKIKTELTACATQLKETSVNNRPISIWRLHTPINDFTYIELSAPRPDCAPQTGVNHLGFIVASLQAAHAEYTKNKILSCTDLKTFGTAQYFKIEHDHSTIELRSASIN